MFTYLVYFYENKFRLKTVCLKLKTKYNTYTNSEAQVIYLNKYLYKEENRFFMAKC